MGWLGRRSWTRLERPVCRAASETSFLKRCAELGLLAQKETLQVEGDYPMSTVLVLFSRPAKEIIGTPNQ
jgi:hypothetical protein